MNLHDIITAVQTLPPHQLEQLRQYIDELDVHAPVPPAASLDMDALRSAIARMREGLSADEIEAIAEAMEAEYIEPVSDDEWDL